MSVILYGPSLALSQVTGLNIWIAIGTCGLVCTIYTSFVRIYFVKYFLFVGIILGRNESSDLDGCYSSIHYISWADSIDYLRYLFQIIILHIVINIGKRFDRSWWTIKSIWNSQKWQSVSILCVCIPSVQTSLSMLFTLG